MIPHYYIFWAILLLTCGYALWRGRKFERVAALMCIAATVVSILAHSPVQTRYLTIEAGDLLVDSAMLIGFVAIALQSDRFWPLWIAGLQLTNSMAHAMKAINMELLPQAYAAAERFWSYPILIILAIATWRSHRRSTSEQQECGPSVSHPA